MTKMDDGGGKCCWLGRQILPRRRVQLRNDLIHTEASYALWSLRLVWILLVVLRQQFWLRANRPFNPILIFVELL